jgi:hypothetical protein
MSMGTAACSGYVRKVDSKLLKVLGIHKKDLLIAAENAGCPTAMSKEKQGLTLIESILCCTPAIDLQTILGVTVSIFRYNRDEGDIYDELKEGIYASFSEDDLFVKKPTKVMTTLKSLKCDPELSSWTTFG